jgi:hypothetical protein
LSFDKKTDLQNQLILPEVVAVLENRHVLLPRDVSRHERDSVIDKDSVSCVNFMIDRIYSHFSVILRIWQNFWK